MINIKEFLNLTYYTSDLDIFLAEYENKHPRISASQRVEMEKYARIFSLRDHPRTEKPASKLWDKF